MYVTSLVPRPSITANAVEGLVKLLHRMTSGGGLEAWLTCHACTSTGVYRKCHTSRRPPDVILRRPSTVLAVIEDLGTRLVCHTFCHNYQASSSSLRYTCIIQLLTSQVTTMTFWPCTIHHYRTEVNLAEWAVINPMVMWLALLDVP